MEVDIKDSGTMLRQMDFVITQSEMEPFLRNAAKRLSKDMKIKGFREGHIPREVVENSLGKERVWQEAAQEAMKKTYVDAMEDKDMKLFGRPEVHILKLAPGNDFEFKVLVPVVPSVQLPDYKEIAASVLKKRIKKFKVEDKEIDDALQWLRDSRAKITKDKETKNNGSSDAPTEASEVGVPTESVGKKKELPNFDDRFAQDLGEFKNLEELKNNLRMGILQEKRGTQKQKFRLLILEGIRKKLDLDVPKILVNQELDKMQDELSQQATSMGLTLEKYLENVKQSLEDVRKGWEDKAKETVVSAVILRLLADKENISVSEEENRYLSRFPNIEEARKSIDSEYLRLYIFRIMRNEKVFELLEGKQNID